jgi:cobalt/nickel transport system permease protein
VHLPDGGFLSPTLCAGAYCLAGAGLALASRRVTTDWTDRTVPLLGVKSAFVFAGQMVNFPVAGGTSGHLLGGMLAATLLGPHAAAMVLATVLIVQCLFFQDGGVTTLGANVLNLALVGVYSGHAIRRLVSRETAGAAQTLSGVAFGAWFSVVAAATACALQIAASGTAPLKLVLPAMVLTHALIGVGEALITVAVLSFVLRVRPDLVHRASGRAAPLTLRTLAGAGIAAALGVALFLSPLASSWPDGLERVAEHLGFGQEATPLAPAPMPDYALPGIGLPWVSTAIAAALGTLICLAATWGMARLLSRWLRRPDGSPQP